MFSEVLQLQKQFEHVDYFPHVLEINGDVCQAVISLNALRQIHNIDESISDDEAIQLLEEIINTPPEQVVSAEERIAAALEFQNILMLPDEEV